MNTISNVVLYEGPDAAQLAANVSLCGFRPPVALNPDRYGAASGNPAVGWVEGVHALGTRLYGDLVGLPRGIYQAALRAGTRLRTAVYTQYKGLGPCLQRIELLGEFPRIDTLGDLVAQFSRREDGGPVMTHERAFAWSHASADPDEAPAPRAVEALVRDLHAALKTRDRAAFPVLLRRVLALDGDLSGAARQLQVAVDGGKWDVVRRVVVHIAERLRAPQSTRGGATMSRTFANTNIADLVAKVARMMADMEWSDIPPVVRAIAREDPAFGSLADGIASAVDQGDFPTAARLCEQVLALAARQGRRAAAMTWEEASADLARKVKIHQVEHHVSFAEAKTAVLADPRNEALVEAFADSRDGTIPGRADLPVDAKSEVARDRVRRFVAEAAARGETVEYSVAMHTVLDHDPALKAEYIGGHAGPVIVERSPARLGESMREEVLAEQRTFAAETGREIRYYDALQRVKERARKDPRLAALLAAYNAGS